MKHAFREWKFVLFFLLFLFFPITVNFILVFTPYSRKQCEENMLNLIRGIHKYNKRSPADQIIFGELSTIDINKATKISSGRGYYPRPFNCPGATFYRYFGYVLQCKNYHRLQNWWYRIFENGLNNLNIGRISFLDSVTIKCSFHGKMDYFDLFKKNTGLRPEQIDQLKKDYNEKGTWPF